MTEPKYPDDLTTLTTATNEFEAGTIIAVLAEADIEAFAFGGTQFMGLTDLRGSRVAVQVRQADLERAQAALKQNVADSVDLDWDEVEFGEVEDDMPIAHPQHRQPEMPPMPVIVRLGYFLALALLVIMAVGGLVLLCTMW